MTLAQELRELEEHFTCSLCGKHDPESLVKTWCHECAEEIEACPHQVRHNRVIRRGRHYILWGRYFTQFHCTDCPLTQEVRCDEWSEHIFALAEFLGFKVME